MAVFESLAQSGMLGMGGFVGGGRWAFSEGVGARSETNSTQLYIEYASIVCAVDYQSGRCASVCVCWKEVRDYYVG